MQDIEKDGKLPNLIYKTNITLISKLNNVSTNKEDEINVTQEYGWKIPMQNISKWNPAVCKNYD